ncbi:DUF2306 domain-containing protein [Neolewinella persica]|uniref:DUF2306 domain-containing protein n=1 Tax=Neolewinella persica TaxID=70998 RepID=UPI0003735438|nr:DUF2306 domain-containing protein [Neolewinella persica]
MLHRLLKGFIVFLAIGVSGYSLSYFDFEVKSLLLLKEELIRQRWYQLLFYSHLAGGAVALSLGGFQFSRTLLRKRKMLHRRIGKTYLMAVAWSGSTGLFIAFLAYGGWIAKLGFAGMAIGWLFTSWRGFQTIRAGNVDAHQRWMLRSYAFTLAAVSFRLWLLGGPLFGIDFLPLYRFDSWAAWVGNLVVAEVYLAFQRPSLAPAAAPLE